MKLTMKILEKNINGTYEIDENGFVNVDGSVDLSGKSLTSFGDIKFGKVSGSFWCSGNKLISLEHSPKEVGGDFDCSHNKLISLEHSPKEVGGYFRCFRNPLTNFDLHCKVEGKIHSDKELNVKHPYSKEILRELINGA